MATAYVRDTKYSLEQDKYMESNRTPLYKEGPQRAVYLMSGWPAEGASKESYLS